MPVDDGGLKLSASIFMLWQEEKKDPEIPLEELEPYPKVGETFPEGFSCERCLARHMYADIFDIHVDWRDCLCLCAYAEERRRECSDIF